MALRASLSEPPEAPALGFADETTMSKAASDNATITKVKRALQTSMTGSVESRDFFFLCKSALSYLYKGIMD